MNNKYDIIVVGGGHAGIEASLSSARLGAKTLLISINLDTIGQMSCNPSIGGVAKGTIAKEIDADGVHVGQSDMEAGNVRKILGDDKIIGVSAQTVEQALLAQNHGADYLRVGAVIKTASNDDAHDV